MDEEKQEIIEQEEQQKTLDQVPNTPTTIVLDDTQQVQEVQGVNNSEAVVLKRGKGRPKGSPNVNHPEQIPPKVPKEKKKQKYKGPPPKKDDRNFQQYVVVRETMKRIKWGWSKEEIYEWLKVWHPTNVETMRLYYKAALAAIDSRLNGRAKDIAETNLNRLEAIFDEAVEEGDRKSALSCIDMMNKMAGLYEHQINLNTNKPLFEIKID